MKRKRSSQSGMVSLVICMLLMIVISLMTLSFATLSRREQRQALDKQLSTQAFYAAETGVNDVAKALLDGALPPTTDIVDCSPEEQNKIALGTTTPTPIVSTLDANSSTGRTCVLVDQSPSQIEDVVGETESTVFLISASGLSSLDIYWENDTAVSSHVFPASINTANGAFPPDADWSPDTPGVLTIQLIPFPATGINRDTIASGTRYVFGFPTEDNSNQTASGTAANGSILTGDCNSSNSPGHCKVTLSNLVDQNYYIRLKSTYDPVHVTIEGKDSLNNRLPFVGAQVLIDATGRANDVTKRIKVYKPLRVSASLPSSVLEIGDDLCKRLQSNPVNTTTDSAIPSCDPNSL